MTNPELIAKAKTAKTVEELLALAKENNVPMTEEEGKDLFAQLNPKAGELSDDELDNVAGGGCGSDSKPDKYYYRYKQDDLVGSGRANCSIHVPGGCDHLFDARIHFHTSDTLSSPWTMTCIHCGKSVDGSGDPYNINGDHIVPIG